MSPTWQAVAGNWVLCPPQPQGIIHFLGGAFIGAASQITYRYWLEGLANQGYAILATSFVNTFDHRTIVQTVHTNFELALGHLRGTVLRERESIQPLPVYGLGHSMGAKLHLLLGSLFPLERSGNIFVAFNNYPVQQSIPFFDRLVPAFNLELEFTPPPQQVLNLAAKTYSISRNLIIQFETDELDDTPSLATVLSNRFPDSTQLQRLPGNHLTPLVQGLEWQSGAVFSPWDAIGQWLRQETCRELHHLQHTVLDWMNHSPLRED